MGDFSSCDDIESPNSRLKYWNESQNTVRQQRKKIKLLTNKNRYLQKKVNNLNSLLKHLKEKNCINDNCYTVLKVDIV